MITVNHPHSDLLLRNEQLKHIYAVIADNGSLPDECRYELITTSKDLFAMQRTASKTINRRVVKLAELQGERS